MDYRRMQHPRKKKEIVSAGNPFWSMLLSSMAKRRVQQCKEFITFPLTSRRYSTCAPVVLIKVSEGDELYNEDLMPSRGK